MRKVLAIAILGSLLLPLLASVPAAASPAPLAAVPVTELTSLALGGRIDQVAYSPDGKHLAIAVDGGPVKVLNATTLAVELNLTAQGNWYAVSSLSWGANSDKLGVGYEGGVVAVWRVPTGTPAWAKSGLGYDVRGVAWSPDSKFLAAGIVHSVFIFWGETGYINATISLDYGGSQPAGLSWSHDSDFIAIGQQALSPAGAIVALFDAKSWGKSLGWRWVGPQMDNVAFEGRGRFLAVQLGGSRVEVWEVRNWTLYSNISTTSGIEHFAWTHDGSRMVMLETEPSARPNQTESFGGFEVVHLGGGAGNSTALAVAPEGKTVAVGYADGTVRILDIGGERLFEDLTPLVGTTGDSLTFSVRASAAGAVRVSYADMTGGRAAAADLTLADGLHTLTITVPADWTGNMRYVFSQVSTGISAPDRIVRILDNDAPTVTDWNFSRSGSRGEVGTVTIDVADNIQVQSATALLAVDGFATVSATAGGNPSLSFSLVAAIAERNQSVCVEVRATDAVGNGGLLLAVCLPLVDLASPAFGADLSQPGTAGGRIQLGTDVTDARGPPTVNVTWRELTGSDEGPWMNFTFGVPSPGSFGFLSTFPLGRNTVAVEYMFAARDASGNTNATATRVQPVLDLEPPEVVADLSDREALQGDPFHLGIAVRDNIGIASVVALVQEDGGETVQVQLPPWSAYGEGTFEGVFTVGNDSDVVAYSFLVTDSEGNTVSSGRRELFVKDNDPPTLRVIEAVLRVQAGLDFSFHVETADRSDVGNLTVYYRRAGDQSYLQEEFRPDSRGGTVVKTARFSVSLSELGISTHRDGRAVEVYFHTLDGVMNAGQLGSAGEPIRIPVLDGAPPVARIEAAGDYISGSAVSLDGSNSEDDLGIVAWEWTIDDQPAGNRSAIAWRVTSAGQHTIKLTVTDGAGNLQTQTLRITATAPAVSETPVGGTLAVALLGVVAAAAAGMLVLWRRKPKRPEEEPQP